MVEEKKESPRVIKNTPLQKHSLLQRKRKLRLTSFQKKKIILVSVFTIVLAAFFIGLKYIPTEAISNLGDKLPLPLFTAIIGLVDGFNPCNIFILTLLMSLLLTESHSRKRILVVSLSFIAVVYVFYFFFMTAWLNIFKYLGFINPLRIGIAILAVIAGLINMKELFFFRKGVTLMIQDRYVPIVKRKIRDFAKKFSKGHLLALVGSSMILAVFSSLVELPCTAGFPIIYTGILTSHAISGLGHYAYIALYNFFYVLPLLTIMFVFTISFNGKQVSKKTMEIIKFIGGSIMFLLGLLLLFAPKLILGI